MTSHTELGTRQRPVFRSKTCWITGGTDSCLYSLQLLHLDKKALTFFGFFSCIKLCYFVALSLPRIKTIIACPASHHDGGSNTVGSGSHFSFWFISSFKFYQGLMASFRSFIFNVKATQQGSDPTPVRIRGKSWSGSGGKRSDTEKRGSNVSEFASQLHATFLSFQNYN